MFIKWFWYDNGYNMYKVSVNIKIMFKNVLIVWYKSFGVRNLKFFFLYILLMLLNVNDKLYNLLNGKI